MSDVKLSDDEVVEVLGSIRDDMRALYDDAVHYDCQREWIQEDAKESRLETLTRKLAALDIVLAERRERREGK